VDECGPRRGPAGPRAILGYQGEQDADPFNATDCNSAGPPATRFVRVAELQAYGAASVVR
jgi:hypothetical protein